MTESELVNPGQAVYTDEPKLGLLIPVIVEQRSFEAIDGQVFRKCDIGNKPAPPLFYCFSQTSQKRDLLSRLFCSLPILNHALAFSPCLLLQLLTN